MPQWQQRAVYKMDIVMDVVNNQFTGHQTISYTNNSPDTLNRVFYHLFFNAFQPGSMMDERSRTIIDPDKRVGDRISLMTENEIGYQIINSMTIDGVDCDYTTEGTILEVDLPKAILPGQSVLLEMTHEAQIPLQIRRSGRDNAEGIRYTMTQWYPKLCEYDFQGWHPTPYIGREFYGVWGDFDVTIMIDPEYILGGTGVLQNAREIGYGYNGSKKGKKVKKGKRKWHFKAEEVHDFAWAADPDYDHIIGQTDQDVEFHYLFQNGPKTEENWNKLHSAIEVALPYMNKRFGKYPYPIYSVIQGGDGGMEYPMCTMITGERSFGSLVGVTIHELFHSWYQMVLGTNEGLYPWMDEGFTSFGTTEVMNYLKEKGIIEGEPQKDPHLNGIRSFTGFAISGLEEPLSTHADHYQTNAAYSVGSYSKGSVFLKQIEYIIGKTSFDRGMLRYYDEWKFKHPTPDDFIRIMEKESGIVLDWFKYYFINSTKSMDYSIDTLAGLDGKTKVILRRLGEFPMPIDLYLKTNDGAEVIYNVPLRVMRGEKPSEDDVNVYVIKEDWPWTHNMYELILDYPIEDIDILQIDRSERMADLNLDNNIFPRQNDID